MSDSALPLVVVSVLNWNTPALTLRCLRALESCDYPTRSIVVVDNASHDDSVAQFRAAWPALTVLQAPANLGFAEGHALALQQAQQWDAAAIWLLNSDAEPEAGALRALVAAWRDHGDAIYGGAPLRTVPDGRRRLNFPPKYLDPDGVPPPLRRDGQTIYDADWAQAPPRRVGAAAGSCLLLPLAVVQRHGWMDAAWFLYCEEIDYCYALRARGVASWLVPQARVWHADGGSSRHRGVADVVAYYRARNEIVLARRHARPGTAAVVAVKKFVRGLVTLFWRPRRGYRVLLGAVDALRGRDGKTIAPEDACARSRQKPATPLWLAWRRAAHRLGVLRRRLWPRADKRCESVGVATLRYPGQPAPYLADYLQYGVMLLRENLRVKPRPLTLAFDEDGEPHDPCVCRVGIQWEHTLVRPGGRDTQDALPGAVPMAAGGNYLVRIPRLASLRACDLVIDYSRANRENIERSGRHADLLAKLVVIAPLLHRQDFAPDGRPLPLICLFGDRRQPRRARLLSDAARRGLPLRHVDGIFDTPGLQRLYRSSRLLLNVHQTDDHHTAEELRILPALQSGMIVISEDVPLREVLPYQRFVIWAAYDELLATVERVLANYAAEHARLFGDGQLERVLAQMAADNHAGVAAAVDRMATVIRAGR